MKKTLNQMVSEFKGFYNSSVKEVLKAAKCYVNVIKMYPDHVDEFKAKNAMISPSTWGLLSRIGRGLTNPRFVQWQDNIGYQALSMCSLEDQSKYMDPMTAIKCLEVDSEGKETISEWPVGNMFSATVKQVFTDGPERSIRSVKQQRAYRAMKLQKKIDDAVFKKGLEESIRIPHKESRKVFRGRVTFLDTKRSYNVEDIDKIRAEMVKSIPRATKKKVVKKKVVRKKI